MIDQVDQILHICLAILVCSITLVALVGVCIVIRHIINEIRDGNL
jgi:hypothetical protein